MLVFARPAGPFSVLARSPCFQTSSCFSRGRDLNSRQKRITSLNGPLTNLTPPHVRLNVKVEALIINSHFWWDARIVVLQMAPETFHLLGTFLHSDAPLSVVVDECECTGFLLWHPRDVVAAKCSLLTMAVHHVVLHNRPPFLS